MNKQKQIIGILLVATILIFSIFMVSAEEISRPPMDIFSQIRFSFASGNFLFTSWGEANGCDSSPSSGNTLNLKNGNSVTCSSHCSYDKCAIDVFRYNSLFLGTTTPSGSVTYTQEVTSGSYTNNQGSGVWDYIEIYCCPQNPPTTENWETDVFTCNSATGGWTSRGSYAKTESCSYDTSGTNLCWCNDEDENFYVDKNNGVHCQPSSYSSVTNGNWCPAPQCTSASQCGTNGYTGSNYCYSGNVAKNYRTYSCSSNTCSYSDENRIQETCVNGCENNQCKGSGSGSDCENQGGICKNALLHPDCDGQTVLGQPTQLGCGVLDKCCKTLNSGNQSTGLPCNTDIECSTKHCDKTAWYSATPTCQNIPWSEVLKVAATKEEISKMTTTETMNLVCLENKECLAVDNESSASCISINKLQEDGTLSFAKDSFFNKARETVVASATGAGIGGTVGIVLCVVSGGTTVLTAGSTAPATALICSAAITGGAVLGGIAGADIQIGISDKDPITAKLDSGDADSVGLCVSEKESAFAKYTSWAAFFPITGDKGTDGLIIIFGGIVLLAILFKR